MSLALRADTLAASCSSRPRGGPDGTGVAEPMSKRRNPQAEQMADESMLRTLTAQAQAIWPREQALLGRYGQPPRIADIGCGSGEITGRLAARYPQADIVGVDILESSITSSTRSWIRDVAHSLC